MSSIAGHISAAAARGEETDRFAHERGHDVAGSHQAEEVGRAIRVGTETSSTFTTWYDSFISFDRICHLQEFKII